MSDLPYFSTRREPSRFPQANMDNVDPSLIMLFPVSIGSSQNSDEDKHNIQHDRIVSPQEDWHTFPSVSEVIQPRSQQQSHNTSISRGSHNYELRPYNFPTRSGKWGDGGEGFHHALPRSDIQPTGQQVAQLQQRSNGFTQVSHVYNPYHPTRAMQTGLDRHVLVAAQEKQPMNELDGRTIAGNHYQPFRQQFDAHNPEWHIGEYNIDEQQNGYHIPTIEMLDEGTTTPVPMASQAPKAKAERKFAKMPKYQSGEAEEGIPVQTRRTQSHKEKVVVGSPAEGLHTEQELKLSAKVKPAIRQANGRLSNTIYIIGRGIREPVPPVKPSGLFFDSYEEACEGVGSVDWMPPANDTSIPENTTEIRPHVLKLRDAMMDMSAYGDNPSKKMQNRWLPLGWVAAQTPQRGDVLTNPYNPKQWLEKRCWDIVMTCIRLHREGPGFISCLDPLTLEKSFKYKDLTFSERIGLIVDMVFYCKNRVSALMTGGFGVVEEYLLIPGDLVKTSKENGKHNKLRQDVLSSFREPYKERRAQEAASAAAAAAATAAGEIIPSLSLNAGSMNSAESDLSERDFDEFVEVAATAYKSTKSKRSHANGGMPVKDRPKRASKKSALKSGDQFQEDMFNDHDELSEENTELLDDSSVLNPIIEPISKSGHGKRKRGQTNVDTPSTIKAKRGRKA
ncbi:uncharacterized protein K460DRAFT_431352 [Cucurbitaria berberidis CBS 394.84]|uniref:Uncharacterized protein n=1 Tax=Cucurbitaria berberidis CBS 394.84 TaxID=1168544 RepID=A0A9P4GIM7_9PLEO|nr:uncharacterized protein K460DRAFT_431352 [Cucurbitaria berberidis CBS 394.84]KAF1846332.1 hypothetical protein K460DRAFT_431352 [Cucurbitaria berberidis CBS 394.84]